MLSVTGSLTWIENVNMGKVRSRKRCRAHLKSSDGKLNSPSESTGATRMEECVCFIFS